MICWTNHIYFICNIIVWYFKNHQINPIFELIDNLVISSIEEKIPRDFVNILSQLKYSSLPNNFAEKFDNSTNRFFHSIEAELSLK
jgi:hypothetical protein